MLYYLIEKHMQNSGTFEGKKISPEKVTYVPLAPNHSIFRSDHGGPLEIVQQGKSYRWLPR